MMSLLEKVAEVMKVGSLDEETTMIVERLAIVRISTKHINLEIRQLETERKDICELAGMMESDEIKEEIGKIGLEE